MENTFKISENVDVIIKEDSFVILSKGKASEYLYTSVVKTKYIKATSSGLLEWILYIVGNLIASGGPVDTEDTFSSLRVYRKDGQIDKYICKGRINLVRVKNVIDFITLRIQEKTS